MTTNGEVQTREEATVYDKQLDLLSKLCFLKKLPQFFPWGNFEGIMVIRTTESAVKNHISLEMTRELIAMYRTMYQLWFLVYQRSSSSTTPSSTSPSSSSQVSVLMSTETPKIQCKKEVEVRVKTSERPSA